MNRAHKPFIALYCISIIIHIAILFAVGYSSADTSLGFMFYALLANALLAIAFITILVLALRKKGAERLSTTEVVIHCLLAPILLLPVVVMALLAAVFA